MISSKTKNMHLELEEDIPWDTTTHVQVAVLKDAIAQIVDIGGAMDTVLKGECADDGEPLRDFIRPELGRAFDRAVLGDPGNIGYEVCRILAKDPRVQEPIRDTLGRWLTAIHGDDDIDLIPAEQRAGFENATAFVDYLEPRLKALLERLAN